MKERPILFSASMMRAILDGSKTQTRRVYKKRKHPETSCAMAASELVREPQHVVDRICPYGQPADRLWVKETWSEVGTMDPGLIVYRANYPASVPAKYQNVPPAAEIKWKSSLFMRRTASRIVLEIVDVRFERLNDCSEVDARAEGARACDVATGREILLAGRANMEAMFGTTGISGKKSTAPAVGKPTDGSGSSSFGGLHDQNPPVSFFATTAASSAWHPGS
jgi:hypothetical protein